VKIVATVLITFVLALALAPPVSACATCFGDAEAPATKGMNAAIGFMLGIVALVQVGFVSLFLGFRRRSRSLDERRNRFKVLQGGLR